MGSMSITHWLIVLAVVLLVFGTGKISGLMGDFAKGIKAFKKGLQDEDDNDKGPPAGQQKIDNAASQQAHEKEKDRANVG